MTGLRKAVSAALALSAALAMDSGAAAPASRGGAPAAHAGPSALVQVQTLRSRTLSATVTGYGRVQPDPDEVVSIAFPHAGLVKQVWVRLGQRVKAGDALLAIATAPSAQVAYQQAKAAVDSARSQLEQEQRLLEQSLATRAQVADARRRLRDAESQLQAQERLGTGKKSQVVKAPFAGIVTQLAVTQGQRVQADTSAMQLASGEALVVSLGVELEDIVRVQPGQPVLLSPVFGSGVQLQAQVHEVHAMIDPRTRLIDVLVRIRPQDVGGLVLGEDLRGTIVVRREEGLAVPRSAILQDAAGHYVFTVGGGQAHRVAVTTGLEQGDWVAVQGALKAGDKVVVTGNYELTDGMAVRELGP